MGLLDVFKKKAPAANTEPDEALAAPGWDAITSAFEGVYPGQTNPYHRAPLVHRMHDISDNAAAFDGISAYAAGEFWHLVTYGLTELYGKDTDNPKVSGFGYELTFKVPKESDTPPAWAFDFLEAIGKAAWEGQTFAAGHVMKTGPLDGRATTKETAVLVVRDPSFPNLLDTPHGQVELLLLLGVEDEYRKRVLAAHEAGKSAHWEAPIVDELREQNPQLVTPISSS